MHMRGWTKAPHARASLPTTPKPRSAPHLCCLGHVATSHGRLLSRREALDFEKKGEKEKNRALSRSDKGRQATGHVDRVCLAGGPSGGQVGERAHAWARAAADPLTLPTPREPSPQHRGLRGGGCSQWEAREIRGSSGSDGGGAPRCCWCLGRPAACADLCRRPTWLAE